MINAQQIAKMPVFHECYRLIRRLFGVDIAILDPDGKSGCLLGQGRELNRFCRAVQRVPAGFQRCVDCDAEHARMSARNHGARRYVCHAGLTEFIIPIVIDREVIALLQCGQVLNHPPTPADWRKACRRLKWITGGKNRLRRAYFQSPVMAPGTQKDLISLLQLFAYHAAVAHARLLLLEQSPQDMVVSRALAFMKSRFRDELRLDQIARAAGASKRNLIRIIRARTGGTILDHLHRLRIAHACELLQTSHAKITQVGLDCGFGSIQQFNRVFRALRHETPRRWREKAPSA